MKDNALDHWRKEIDAIDKQLLSLLAKRTEIIRKVGKFKKENKIKPLDEERWQEVLNNKLSQAKELKLPKNMIKAIYNKIHHYSLKIEEKIK